MLRRAEVGETPADDGVVEPGMKVTYKFAGDADDDAETFLLGAREMADTTDGLKVYSPQSPLGSAIIGKQEGRHGHLRGAQRQAARGRDRRRGALHRLSPTARRPAATRRGPSRAHWVTV